MQYLGINIRQVVFCHIFKKYEIRHRIRTYEYV